MKNSLYSLLSYSILALIIYFIYRFVIKVYLRVLYYRNQNIPVDFKPFIGNFFEIFQSVKKHGDFCYPSKRIVTLKPKPKLYGWMFLDKITLGVFDPRCIQEIMQNPGNYIKSPAMSSLQKLLLGQGLILSEGDLWKRQRKYCTMAFHYNLISDMIPDIYSITNEFFDRKKTEDLQRLNVMDDFQRITAEVVGRFFFGRRFNDLRIDGEIASVFLEKLVGEAQQLSFDLTAHLFGPEFIKWGILKRHRVLLNNIKKFREFASRIIKETIEELTKRNSKEENKRKQCLIEIFYDQIKMTPDDPLSQEELTDIFISFFAAGMDTTAHLSAMATYYAMINPELKKKLMAEISNFPTIPTKLTTEILNSMEYTTAFLKETLRVVPPAPFFFPREAVRDHEIGGFKILKGDILNAVFIGLNFDSDYHESPNEFNPQRWISDSLTKRSVTEDPYVFTPFSAGPKNCIGQHLAMLEAKVIFSLFLKKFEYELTNKEYEMKFNFRFLYEPDKPLIYRAIRKDH